MNGSTLGRKADGLRFDLIPEDALAEVAYVFTAGAKKYDDRNWEFGYSWSRSVRALISHLSFWQAGEEFDAETNSRHLAQVAWHALVLLAFSIRGIGTDDRRHPSDAVLRALHAVRERRIPDIPKYGISVPKYEGPKLKMVDE
jgi:hypothetical protein